jgi:hypothetical protein
MLPPLPSDLLHFFLSSLKCFAKTYGLTPLLAKKIENWLVYWGARMHQIAECFPRPDDRACLAESIHGKWFKIGGVGLSVGGAAAFDYVEAVQVQVLPEYFITIAS